MKELPKTREGLIQLIVNFIAKQDTTYISFCAELEAFQKNHKQGESIDWYCNGHCKIHEHNNSHALLCLPLSFKKMLEEPPT